MPRESNIGSVLLETLGAGLKGAGQASKEKAATEQQNKIQAFMIGLQAEQQRIAQERHNQAMLLGANKLQASDLKLRQIQKESAMTPAQKVIEQQKLSDIADTQFMLSRIGEETIAPELGAISGLGIPSAEQAVQEFRLPAISREQGIGALRGGLQPGEQLALPSGQTISGGKEFAPVRQPQLSAQQQLILDNLGLEGLLEFGSKTGRFAKAKTISESGERTKITFAEKKQRNEVLDKANTLYMEIPIDTRKELGIIGITSSADLEKVLSSAEKDITGVGFWFDNDENKARYVNLLNLFQEHLSIGRGTTTTNNDVTGLSNEELERIAAGK